MRPTAPVTKLKLAGTEYKLVYDFDAIAEAEEILDRPLISGLRKRDITTPTVNLVRAMFFGCAHSLQPNLTFEQAKALVTKQTLTDVWVKVLEAWTSAQPEPDETASENPQQDQS